jgi:tetratricopeptide (TPR) repeat protein
MGQARRSFIKGLAQSPEHGLLHANLGAASYSLKRYAEAARHFEKAYAFSKEPSPEMLYQAGVAFFQGESYRRSQAVLERLLRESGEARTEWVEVLTYALIRQDKWDRARRTILDLLDRSPAERRYWKLLAQVHLQQKAYREAAGALEIAYRIRPPDPSGWRELSDIYAYVGAPLQAAEALKRSFGESPEAKDWSELARLFARGYRYEQAISCLDRAIEGKGTAALLEEKGRMCYAAGKYEEAILAMQSAAAKGSRRGEPYLWIGYAACQLLDWDLAQEAFSEAERFAACQKRAKHGLESVRSILQAKQSIPGSSQASS